MFLSPLEQFTIEFSVFSETFFYFFNNFVHVFLYIFILFVFIIYFSKNFNYLFLKNHFFIHFFYFLYKFILNIISSQTSRLGSIYFPFYFYLFIFIMFSNVLGMFPYTMTLTSQFSLTFAISCVIFGGINSIAFNRFGVSFFQFFLPHGVPFLITPFLTLIELISYFFRLFSVGIRMFANMTSGHVLMKILSGFSWAMFKSSFSLNSLIFANFFLLIIMVVLIFLELSIAFLQAYVLIVLNSIYLKDALFMSH